MLMKGDIPVEVKELKKKLSTIWGIKEGLWHLTPMGKDFYILNLKSDELKSRVFFA